MVYTYAFVFIHVRMYTRVWTHVHIQVSRTWRPEVDVVVLLNRSPSLFEIRTGRCNLTNWVSSRVRLSPPPQHWHCLHVALSPCG